MPIFGSTPVLQDVCSEMFVLAFAYFGNYHYSAAHLVGVIVRVCSDFVGNN